MELFVAIEIRISAEPNVFLISLSKSKVHIFKHNGFVLGILRFYLDLTHTKDQLLQVLVIFWHYFDDLIIVVWNFVGVVVKTALHIWVLPACDRDLDHAVSYYESKPQESKREVQSNKHSKQSSSVVRELAAPCRKIHNADENDEKAQIENIPWIIVFDWVPRLSLDRKVTRLSIAHHERIKSPIN